jgi:hypothetical protein
MTCVGRTLLSDAFDFAFALVQFREPLNRKGAMRLGLWGIKLATLALAIGGCGVVHGHEGVANMTIYYVPIGAETLTAVTSTNIQERGRRCEIHSAKDDIDKIKSVLRGATKPPTQKFSDGRVRVKLLEPSNASDGLLAVIEKEGEVRFSDGTEGLISRKGLETIKKIIEAQCRP